MSRAVLSGYIGRLPCGDGHLFTSERVGVRALVERSVGLVEIFLMVQAEVLHRGLFRSFGLLVVRSLTGRMFPCFLEGLGFRLHPFPVVRGSASYVEVAVNVGRMELSVVSKDAVRRIAALCVGSESLTYFPFGAKSFRK